MHFSLLDRVNGQVCLLVPVFMAPVMSAIDFLRDLQTVNDDASV